MIRTRFAPSPTGELHIGGARTALFAYLFAKSQGGEFLLRIEDTDRERFVEGATERIIESLKWLNIVPDNIENPMVQSDRLEEYKKHAFDLVRAGKAYICTCSKEKLASDREKQEKGGKPPRYEGNCRGKSEYRISNIKDMEGKFVIRMKVPEEGKIVVDDMIRGAVEFGASLLDDQIILKSDGYPTYHLASVVDDHEMEITHVIRAEEWLSSTPKHLILYEMFGWEAPKFAHLPMILGPDHKKLSKRHGATSVSDYQAEGYLSEALINFMAFLGWNPKDDSRQYFTLQELIGEFKITNVNKSAAVFDIEKLKHINEYYLRTYGPKNLRTLISGELKGGRTEEQGSDITDGELELVQRGGCKTLNEAEEYIQKLRKTPEYDPKLLVFKKSSEELTKKGLGSACEKLSSCEQWESGFIQQLLADVVSEGGLSNGDVFWPVRVALSGKEKSPSPVELMLALGKEKTLSRIKNAIEKLKD
jgi:glutamyl-tRNA synthetase